MLEKTNPFFSRWFLFVSFFLVVEEEGAALAQHLPEDSEGNCFLASASSAGCKLVEAFSASRKPKTENFSSTDNTTNSKKKTWIPFGLSLSLTF
jgi:hypothetical protein